MSMISIATSVTVGLGVIMRLVQCEHATIPNKLNFGIKTLCSYELYASYAIIFHALMSLSHYASLCLLNPLCPLDPLWLRIPPMLPI